MAVTLGLNRRAVLTGAAAHVLVTLPAGIIGNAVSGNGDSNVAVVFAAVVLFVGPLVGGAVAARRQRATPLTHGAAATAIGWIVVVVYAVVGKLIAGHGVPVMRLIAVGIVSVSLGTLGGYFTFRRELRQEARGT